MYEYITVKSLGVGDFMEWYSTFKMLWYDTVQFIYNIYAIINMSYIKIAKHYCCYLNRQAKIWSNTNLKKYNVRDPVNIILIILMM